MKREFTVVPYHAKSHVSFRRDGPCGRPLQFRQELQIFPATREKYWLRQCDFVPKSPDARKGRPYEILVGSVYAVGAERDKNGILFLEGC